MISFKEIEIIDLNSYEQLMNNVPKFLIDTAAIESLKKRTWFTL